MGQTIVTTDEIPDPHTLRIKLTVNGAVMQDSNTSQLIFRVPQLIEFITRSITLEPGDVIATGTPAGVGYARKPPVFLKAGDIMEVNIERIGGLGNPIVASGLDRPNRLLGETDASSMTTQHDASECYQSTEPAEVQRQCKSIVMDGGRPEHAEHGGPDTDNG